MSDDRATNNKFENCPARMSDGRQFTIYAPRCQTNFYDLPRPLSSYDYRMFLTENAEKIMDADRDRVLKNNYCGPCVDTMLPEQTKQVCDGRVCAFPLNEPDGLGLGRRYDTQEGTFQAHNETIDPWGAPLV